MLSRRSRLSLWSASAAVVAAAAALTLARPRPTPRVLQKARPQRAVIEAHAQQRYALPLALRDCAFGTLQPWADQNPASDLQLVVREPREARALRQFTLRKSPLEFGFCVEAAGTYELEVRAAEAAGGYELALERVLPRGAALPKALKSKPLAANSQSPRLRAAAAGLHEPGRLDQFWNETKRTGTPLIEPADADTSWVSFLYRGTDATREVSVSWPMWTFEFTQTQLAHLPGTDVWWKSLRLPNATRLSYQLIIDPPSIDAASAALGERAQAAVTQADPYNQRSMSPELELDVYAQRSVLQLPAAEPERWLDPKSKPAPGRLERQSLRSAQLGHEHSLTLYLPAGYDTAHARAYPLLIFFDGEDYLRELAAPRLLDALIAARAISPVVALFVHNDDPSRRAEELPCNAAFAAFVANELLPFARTHYRLSTEAAQTGLAGSSFGGLASSFIALTYPEHFGKVLSQSGSFWWSFPADHAAYDGSDKPGWLRRRFEQRPVTKTRFYLGAGSFEGSPEADGVLEQNRLQCDALRALGYSVAYQEYSGGHDPLAWRATLPDALIALYAPGL